MRALSIVGGGVRLLAGVGLVLSLGVGAPPAAQAAITLGAPRAVAGTFGFSGVGCTSAGCVAVGSNFAGEGAVVPVAADGTPGRVRADAGTHELGGVGCTSAGCVAVGSNFNFDFATGYGFYEGVVVPVAADGTPGRAQTVAGTDYFSGVGCTSAGCVAVGSSAGEGVVVPVAADGTPGSARTVAGTQFLDGVGCTSAGCVAVGTNSY
ncbi:MAG: hypothetical protein M3Y17_06970, partial [Actinomycetota bacterium]|nr:hypothetical protein [Actinomycetota bacterium]